MLWALLQCLAGGAAAAQQRSSADTTAQKKADSVSRVAVPPHDIWDVAKWIFGRDEVPPPVLTPPNPDSVTSDVLILPAIGLTPAAGLKYGATLTYVGRIGSANGTRLSQASLSATYSTKGQLNVSLKPTLYLPTNHFAFEGDVQYLSLNENTYGLGPLQPDSLADNVGLNLIRTYLTAYASPAANFYIGPGYRLDQYFNIHDRRAVSGEPSPVLDYNGGVVLTSTTASGLALSTLYESRDNPINPSRGYYARADVEAYPAWMGNGTNWQAFRLEGRTYVPVQLREGYRTILAFWTFGWFTTNHPPYFSLPALGWDRKTNSGRGYVQGQIRAPGLLYGETEIRQPIRRDGLLGVVGFVNLTFATDPSTGALGRGNPAYGAGLRVKLNKKTNQNIRLDLAFRPGGTGQFFLGSEEAF